MSFQSIVVSITAALACGLLVTACGGPESEVDETSSDILTTTGRTIDPEPVTCDEEGGRAGGGRTICAIRLAVDLWTEIQLKARLSQVDDKPLMVGSDGKLYTVYWQDAVAFSPHPLHEAVVHFTGLDGANQPDLSRGTCFEPMDEHWKAEYAQLILSTFVGISDDRAKVEGVQQAGLITDHGIANGAECEHDDKRN